MTSLCRVNNYISYDVIQQVKAKKKETSSDCEASVTPENHDETVSQVKINLIEKNSKQMTTCCNLLEKNAYGETTKNTCKLKTDKNKINTPLSTAYRFSIDKILENPQSEKISGNQSFINAASKILQQPHKAARKWQINNNDDLELGKRDEKSHEILGSVNTLNQPNYDGPCSKKKISTDSYTEQRTQQLTLARLEYFRKTLNSEKSNNYESLNQMSDCKKLAVEESKRIAASVLCSYYGMQMNGHNQVKTWQDIFARKKSNFFNVTQENINGLQNNSVGNLGKNLPLKVDFLTNTKRKTELPEENNNKHHSNEVLKTKSISNRSPLLQSSVKSNSDIHKEKINCLNQCVKKDARLDKNEGMSTYVCSQRNVFLFEIFNSS